jgi:hypothetical protein
MSNISRRELVQGLFAGAAAIGLADGVPARAGLSGPPAQARPVVGYKIKERFQSIPFERQQLRGLFADRIRVNLEARLLQVNEVALLQGYVLPRVPVESWEGEHAGMFLDAASNVLRYTQDARLKALADRIAAALLAIQEPDGYLGTFGPGRHLTGVDVWIHRWNLDGLLNYYAFTGEAKYLTACRRVGDLLCRTFGDAPGQRSIALASADQVIHALSVEASDMASMDAKRTLIFGSLLSTTVVEPMCTLYRLTGEHRYLQFARYVVAAPLAGTQGPSIVQLILEPGGLAPNSHIHAYTLLANYLGVLELYKLTGQEELRSVALKSWEDIQRNQVYITGGTGRAEYFQPDGLQSLFSSNIGECCATVTWLQFNWQLFRLTGEARFGHEIERAVYNHLFAAQDPHNGDICYFTALTGHKEYSSDVICCTSNGPRGISLIPQWVWGVEKDAFVINLFTAGTASFDIDGVPVRVVSETDFPLTGEITLKISPESAVPFTVRLRVPEWAQNFEVNTGDRTWHGSPGQMLDVTRTWTQNAVVDIRMDLTVRALPGGPTYPNYIALQRGPQILALERGLNAHVPYLERAAVIPISGGFAVARSQPPAEWSSRPVYESDGVFLRSSPTGTPMAETGPLRFVPFADAVDYRVWIARPDNLPRTLPAATAFARGWAPAQAWLLHGGTEALTDENPETFCTVDPRAPGAEHPKGKKGDPVWFAVTFQRPLTISRVLFRHGPSTEDGGWFGTAKGKPLIQVALVPRGRVPSATDMLKDSDWLTVGAIEDYPDINADSSSNTISGRLFEVALPEQVRGYGIRVIGHPARNHVTCAELGAYA